MVNNKLNTQHYNTTYLLEAVVNDKHNTTHLLEAVVNDKHSSQHYNTTKQHTSTPR